MVYCTKCGTKNDDDATVCSNCNESLSSHAPTRRERQKKESECFGLPHGGSIAGIVIGLLIVLWGVSQILGGDLMQYLWPIVVIIFGTLMVARALYTIGRKR